MKAQLIRACAGPRGPYAGYDGMAISSWTSALKKTASNATTGRIASYHEGVGYAARANTET
jgi:hypothetical protein